MKKSDKPGIKIICNSDGVPLNRKNTCYKAAELFSARAKIKDFGAEITINKNIPSMAGLGGGSSDAAAVLRILNKLYGTDLKNEELISVAADVGADVPFLINGGCALCLGIGEKITEIKSYKKYFVLLVKPKFGISTPQAYKAFDDKGLKSENRSKAMLSAFGEGSDISNYLSNDLELAVGNEEIFKIEEKLINLGASGSKMTGSGSCVFGLFESKAACEAAKNALSADYPFVCACETL